MSDSREKIGQISKLFDAVSETYDSVGVEFFQPIASGLVRVLAPSFGESWLDIGCGRGAIAENASPRLGASGEMLGFDISEKMIGYAKVMASRNNLRNVSFLVDDAQEPEKIDGKFDVISSCLVLFFLPDPLLALKNWHPFLKHSGRIGVTTFGQNDPRWMEIDQILSEYLPSRTLDARTSGIQSYFASDFGMESLLSDAGFHEVTTVKEVIPVIFKSLEKWYEFSWSTGQRGAWLQIPEEERALVRARAEALLKNYMQNDGSILFNQEVRHTLAKR